MPRNGKLVRIAFALVAASLIGALAATSASAGGKRSTGTLTGAGSSLIGPAVAVWSQLYKPETINYAAIGSGGGIAQISARNVDFGASDAPLTKSQGAGCHSCVQIPWALTATSPVVNIPGVPADKLHLTGTVLANIYLGNITTWNDPAIKKLNPGLGLPNTKITPVHRSDGSGDTYVFTNYLSKVNHTWKTKVGCATTVSWPSGVGGSHNDGVAAVVRSTPGSIGYVSVAYTIANHLSLARLKNASGKYLLPTIATIESAAQLVKSERIPANNKISITNPPKSTKYQNAYPLATFTYVLIPQQTAKAAQLKAFVTWALGSTAQSAIKKLVFAPMPTVVVKAAKKTLATIHS
ncbi:MAG: phosphate ABC transporter substrate-binding protein PstS [Actinobacteria bacterium]|nr:MAG: phosphate ABC transporter substrate-binding protein PstS [Actinomycetota bacterium]